MDWIYLEIRQPNQQQASRQTKYNFQNNSSKRSTQRDTQHLSHGLNSPHLSRTRGLSVNTQTTTITAPPGPVTSSLLTQPPTTHQFSHSKLQPKDPIKSAITHK